MSWTDDRVELLTKLWGEGKTAKEIAEKLGGVTRNAVIGKAHRLKLSGRASPIQQSKKKTVAKVPANTSKPVAVTPEKKVKKPTPVRQEKASEDSIDLIDLGAHNCRWPIGDPQEKNFGFCGDESLPSLPYCLEHSKLAYQPATRKRILKAEEKRGALQKIANK